MAEARQTLVVSGVTAWKLLSARVQEQAPEVLGKASVLGSHLKGEAGSGAVQA